MVGMAVGLTVAAFFPGTTKAASLAQYWFSVPVRTDGQMAQLSCGWHWSACWNNDDGPALDWDSYPSPQNFNVYLRGSGYAPTYSYALLSYADPRSAPGEFVTCQYNTIADVYRASDSAWQVSLGYTHTISPTAAFYLPYGNPAHGNSGAVVASMATSADPSGRGWGGEHTHAWDAVAAPLEWPPTGVASAIQTGLTAATTTGPGFTTWSGGTSQYRRYVIKGAGRCSPPSGVRQLRLLRLRMLYFVCPPYPGSGGERPPVYQGGA
jgi:hypothetical protein